MINDTIEYTFIKYKIKFKEVKLSNYQFLHMRKKILASFNFSPLGGAKEAVN